MRLEWLALDDGERRYVVDVLPDEAERWVAQFQAGGYVALGPFGSLEEASAALSAGLTAKDEAG